MKKIFYTPALLLILATWFMFSSCVSSSKLADSEAKVYKLEREKATALDQVTNCMTRVDQVTAEKLQLQKKYDAAQTDMNKFVFESNLTIEDQANRIRGLNNLVYLQKKGLNDLISSLQEALMSYQADELSVYTKDGKVYVSLEEKLLFKSGSDVVDPKGKEALKTLAGVLNSTKDITVMIEGHTDSEAIKTQKYKDNWDLSTARATSIVRALTVEYGLDPTRITASGKGKHQPVGTNETKEGRAANRRTEIILTPNLEDLFKVLYQ
jgi:chemotaxis protein MotB